MLELTLLELTLLELTLLELELLVAQTFPVPVDETVSSHAVFGAQRRGMQLRARRPRLGLFRRLPSHGLWVALFGSTLLLSCGDDDDSTETSDVESDATDATGDAGETVSDDGSTEGIETDASTDVTDDVLTDLHGVPTDGSEGEQMCAELARYCHGHDTGADDLASECHDIGHLGDEPTCMERYDECIAFCVADGGTAHDHSQPLELSDDDDVPALALLVEADARSGWNLHVELTDFELAPEHASTEHVPGEGHMHLYVDGEKLTRVYGEWFHLDGLVPGEHELRMELSANSHQPFSYQGELIDEALVIEQPPAEPDSLHAPGEPRNVEPADAPSVGLSVHVDPKSGWNLEITTDGFTSAPEHASGEHIAGEGHFHLYVDGVKRHRVYSDWYYLAGLSEGEHEVAIELTANDHRAYALDGEPIQATAHVTVSADQASDDPPHADDHAHEVADGGAPHPEDPDAHGDRIDAGVGDGDASAPDGQ